jgi:hypothetical protein
MDPRTQRIRALNDELRKDFVCGTAVMTLDDRFRESRHNRGIHLGFLDSYIANVCPEWSGAVGVMAAWRRAIELSLGDADIAKLRSIAQSRTEPASRVERRGYCWPTGKTRRFLPSAGRSGCIIRPSNAASSVR